jgi:heterodisulfide reductase subunit A2
MARPRPKSVGIIHCVGSRDRNFNNYCSVICCMQSLKFAHLVHERTGATVYNFYIDMRTAAKAYDEFYQRVLEEGTLFVRGKVAEVTDAARLPAKKASSSSRWKIRWRASSGASRGYGHPFERHGAAQRCKEVGKMFGISCSTDGWFIEKHPKLDPVATMTEGIYIAGCAQGPKDIPSSVAQGAAASARVLDKILQKEVALEPVRATWTKKCSGCRICNGPVPVQRHLLPRRPDGDRDQPGAVPGLRHLRGGLPGGRDQRHGLQRRADHGADRRPAAVRNLEPVGE